MLSECQPDELELDTRIAMKTRSSERGRWGVLVMDDSCRIINASPEALELLNLSATTISSRSSLPLPSELADFIASARKSGAGVSETRITLENDGTRTRLTASLVRLVPGQPQVIALVLSEPGETQDEERRLEHLERLASLGTLSASIAHEVKNALVAVTTLVNLLLEKEPNAELGELARRELKRVERLISQTLQLAAPPRPAFLETNLHETLENALSLVNSQAAERAVSIHRCFEAGAYQVQGDAAQLQQAFLNLLLNALEAIGQHGSLDVKTENISEPAPGGSDLIRVTIHDTGPGIAAEHLHRIFEEYFTTKPQGTGLGLAITRRIIEQHGGAVRVFSEPGQGTRFDIQVPLHKSS